MQPWRELSLLVQNSTPSALGNQFWGRDFSLPPTPNLSEGHSKRGWSVEWFSESTVKNFTLFPRTKKCALRKGLHELRGTERERETADYSKHMRRWRWVENIQLNNFNFNGPFELVDLKKISLSLLVSFVCLFYLLTLIFSLSAACRLSIVFGLLFASRLSHFRISISISMSRNGDEMRDAVNLFTLKFVQHFCPSSQPPRALIRFVVFRTKERKTERNG